MLAKNILNIFKFFPFFAIFILIIAIIVRVVFKDKKYDGKSGSLKIRLFGLLMKLDDLTIFSLSVLIIRFLFIIWSLFTRDTMSIVYFYTLLFLSVLFAVTSRSFKNLIIETFSSIFIYLGLVASSLLAGYIVDVDFIWYVYLGNILLIFFLIIYSIFFLLRNINDLIARSKYVRRNNNEKY